MKRLTLMALAVVLGGGIAAAQQTTDTSQGQDTSNMQGQAPSNTNTGEQGQAKTKWAMPHHFRGTVQSVDAANGKLTVRDKKGNTKDFVTSDNAKIMQGHTKVGLDALTVGDDVTVSYKGTGAAPQAEKVWIRKASHGTQSQGMQNQNTGSQSQGGQ